MPDSPDILRLRVLLYLLREDEKNCTVMEITRTLGEKHYTVSRTIASLEKDGLISRKIPRRPRLTEAGSIQAMHYAERISITMSHLLYEGVNVESAKSDAYSWALYNTEETMEVIRSAAEKYKVKYELREQRQFSGAELCKKLKNGEYRFPFIIYRESTKNGSNISMANEGFEHPCILSIKDGMGTMQLKAVDVTANSAATGESMNGHIKSMKYFDNGSYINADQNGNVLSFPASVLSFRNIGEGMEQILHGMVCLRMQCTAGIAHMPEAEAIFTVLI